MIIVLFIAIPLGLSGILLWYGVRGYRVGDHPVCRRCGFDLFGSPLGNAVCGECGGTLSGHIVIGHHQRRPKLIIAGAAIAVPFLLIIATSMWGTFNGTNWLKYAPIGFLTWRGESTNPAARSAALTELDSRFKAGTLGTGDIDNIADAALAYQADLSKPWDTGWGNLLEAFQSSGKLSADRWKRYLTQASQGAFALRMRNQVRHGDGLPWEVERTANRAGTGEKLQISFDAGSLEWLSTHGPMPKTQYSYALQTSLYGSGGASPTKLQAADFPEPLPDGVQQVHIHGTVKVGFPTNTTNNWLLIPIVQHDIDLPGSFTLLPANTPIIQDPQQSLHTDQIRKSLSVEVSYLSSGLVVVVTQHATPMAIDVNVLVRSNGREVNVGGFGSPAQPAGSMPCGVFMQPTKVALRPDTVDVILRSNPDFIVPDSWPAGELWTGEIIFKDVPVK